MVRVSRIVSSVVVCVCVLWCAAIPAFADGWPLREYGEVICAYAVEYDSADGATAVHSGIDLAALPDAEIVAIEAGTVSFVGFVPSPDGGTILAVTIVTESGDKWSYLPFERAVVEPGMAVSPGVVIGRLAPQGDRSSGVTHLHVGLRCGDHYVDPTGRLVAPVASAEVTDGTSEVVESEQAPTVEPQSSQDDQSVAVDPDPVPGTLSQPQTNPSPVQDSGGVGDAVVRPEVETIAAEQMPRFMHDPETYLGVISGHGAISSARVASVDERTEPEGSTMSALVPRALFAAGCLGLLAVLSSCEAVRERVTVLRESVAAAVSR